MRVEHVRGTVGVILPPAVVALVLVLVLSATGCGDARPTQTSLGSGSVGVAVSSVTTMMAGTSETPGDAGEAPGAVSAVTRADGAFIEGWVPSSPDVVAVFMSEAARVACPVYVPSRLPAGAVVVAGAEGGSLLGEGGALSVVRLATVSGSMIEIAQGIAGDVGDLPGESCGAVAGRPATVYRMLGGYLVQWSNPPWWYGVFSAGLPKEAVIELAVSMERSDQMEPR
ncbi:MAG: hypothetical protein ACYC33_10765 [Thermoleophilia bacterium]